MSAHRRPGETELAGNLPVREAGGHVLQDLLLPAGERNRAASTPFCREVRGLQVRTEQREDGNVPLREVRARTPVEQQPHGPLRGSCIQAHH